MPDALWLIRPGYNPPSDGHVSSFMDVNSRNRNRFLREPQTRAILILPVLIQVILFPFAATLEVTT